LGALALGVRKELGMAEQKVVAVMMTWMNKGGVRMKSKRKRNGDGDGGGQENGMKEGSREGKR